MRLNQKQLNNLPVYTRSGAFLGRIADYILDTQTHQIVQYLVGSSSWLKNILSQQAELLVASDQVISLSEEKMVVQDAIIKDRTNEPVDSQVAAAPDPVALTSLRKELS